MIAAILVTALLVSSAQDGARLKIAPAPKAHAAQKARTPAKPKAKAKAKPKSSPPKPAATPQVSNTPVADPLSQATDGKMQCYAPDTVKRTCASLAEYSDNGDGTWSNISSVLISSNPVAVLKTVTPVAVRDGAICGYIKPEDIAAGSLTINGTPLSAEDAAPTLTRIGTAMSFLYDHEICTRYYPNGRNYTAKVTLDGEPNGQPDNEVLWVGPKDGYGVAP